MSLKAREFPACRERLAEFRNAMVDSELLIRTRIEPTELSQQRTDARLQAGALIFNARQTRSALVHVPSAHEATCERAIVMSSLPILAVATFLSRAVAPKHDASLRAR
jgi:hypothetical protein